MEPGSATEEYYYNDSAPVISEHVCLNLTSFEAFRTCIREQALSQLRHMHPTQANIFTFLYVCISLLGVLGNGLVIIVVVRRAEMRTTRNVFIVNLALSNFILALILVPFLWLPTYRIEFPYGAFMCKVAQAFPGTNIFCSTLTVSAIAVDRYFAVVRSHMGPGTMKTVQAILVAAAVWVLSFSLSIIYLLHFNIKDYVLPSEYLPSHITIASPDDQHILLFQRCELQPSPCLEIEDAGNFSEAARCHNYFETVVSGIMAVFIYLVPMPILVVFSVLLTRFLSKNERQQILMRHRVTNGGTTDGCGTTTPKKLSPSHPLMAGSSSPRPPTSRRSRTTALLFAMAFVNALLWLPFTVISLFIQLSPSEVTQPYDYELRQLDDAAKLISMLSICVNPFLYGYLNTNFQREFKSIFRACYAFICRKVSTKSAILLLPTNSASRAREVENSVTVYVNGEYVVRNWAPVA